MLKPFIKRLMLITALIVFGASWPFLLLFAIVIGLAELVSIFIIYKLNNEGNDNEI